MIYLPPDFFAPPEDRRVGGDRRQPETRELVCESTNCNPGIHDYDQVAQRYAMFGGDAFARSYVAERALALQHSTHIEVQQEFYDVRMGWVRRWKCTKCGNVRKF